MNRTFIITITADIDGNQLPADIDPSSEISKAIERHVTEMNMLSPTGEPDCVTSWSLDVEEVESG